MVICQFKTCPQVRLQLTMFIEMPGVTIDFSKKKNWGHLDQNCIFYHFYLETRLSRVTIFDKIEDCPWQNPAYGHLTFAVIYVYFFLIKTTESFFF
jgi:hypothetical protein